MSLTEKEKAYIDSRTYEELLHRWRFASMGDAWFQGERGDYWAKRMTELREQPGGEAEHVRASRAIGWGGLDEWHT